MVEVTPNAVIELVNSNLYSLIDSGLSQTAIKRELRASGLKFGDETFRKVYGAYVGGDRVELALYADYETPDETLFNSSSRIIPGNYGIVAEVGYFDEAEDIDKTTLWFFWFDDMDTVQNIKLEIANDFENRYAQGRGPVTFVNLIQGYVS
jgi:hypothetical protein